MSINFQGLASRVFLWQRANQVIYLLRNLVLALFIVPDDFGIFAMGLTLGAYASILATFEFRTAFFATKELSVERMRVQWSLEILLNMVTCLIGIVLMACFRGSYDSGVMVSMICILGVNVIEAFFSTPLYLLEKDLQFPFLSRMQAVVNGASFCAALFFAVLGWGWIALVIDRIVAALMKGIILYWKSSWRPRFLIRKDELRYYWSFASILFLTGSLGRILWGFDIYAIGHWIGKYETGIYNMAMKWALLPMELGAGFIAVMALSLYSHQHHDHLDSFRKSYTEITFHIVRFCMAIATLMAIFMKDFFAIAYNNHWQAVPVIFLALLPYAIFRPLYQNVCQALQARKDLKPILVVTIFQFILAISAIYWSVDQGLTMVALSVGGAMGLGYMILEFFLHRKVGYPIFRVFAVPILLSVGILAAWFFLASTSGINELWKRILLALIYFKIAFWEWWKGRERFQSQ